MADKKDQLTQKQLLWLKAYIETGNATKAALEVYDCKDYKSAQQIGYENLRKLEIPHLMEEMGLSKKNLLSILAQNVAKPTKKVLKRTRTRVEVIPGVLPQFAKDSKGRMVLTNEEQVTEFEYVDAIDYQARNKALDTALRLQKVLDKEDPKLLVENATIQIINYADAKETAIEGEVVTPEGGEKVEEENTEQVQDGQTDTEATSSEETIVPPENVLDSVAITSYADTTPQG